MALSRVPNVSVVMGVYNGSRYIKEAVGSILSQTFGDFELIIVDDGSTDDTIRKIQEFTDERIVWASVCHGGLTRALNYGIRLARGRYVARMDADDIALPMRFEKQVEFLEQHPEVGAVGTAYEVLLENGERRKPNVPLLTTSERIKKTLPKLNPIFHGSALIRRKVLEKVGAYDESFRLAQDYDLWFRIARSHELANLDEVLMIRREGKETLQKENIQNWYGIKARVKAIHAGNSGLQSLVHLVRPFFVAIFPARLKTHLRRSVDSKAF